eukprot:TRINITY_DN7205_c0_g1_i1.p1 TRINITY_DN7205_c0_g1~~TRINITY_DN7205_c0_g1_i1.p1  ORF type:complete len:190 (+),score=22.88 TRINITY_DN7205_c0_g1_i1:16-585(+)
MHSGLICPTEKENTLLITLGKLLNEATAGVAQIFVAGGWVRDKVLGLQSNDIDFVVSGLSLSELETKLLAYKASENSKVIQGIRLWKKNPEKGKLFDVLMVKIGGEQLEFIAPRSLPGEVVSQGMAGEMFLDARCRDLTINSLFFNVTTFQVHDCTGHGLEDIKKRRIRTPVAPEITMRSDPLRLMRVV